jgi:DNA repair photolyase
MTRATYTEIECKTALNRVTNMGFAWSLNPYRGCVHACAYCYARANHTYLGLNAGSDFETRLFVKTNIVEKLHQELARPGWKRDEVAVGTATDPYQPIEGKYRLTAGIISALADAATPANIVTKSPLVIRDIDELCRLDERAGVRLCMTITTMDDDIWRIMEPGTAPPKQRLRALKMLSEAGIPCGVYLAPILPRITDSEDSIRATMGAARDAGAGFVWSSGLRLAPDVREHYLVTIAAHYPGLLDRYEHNYRTAEPPAIYRDHIRERVRRIRAEFGFNGDEAKPVPKPATHERERNREPMVLQLPLLSA